MPPLAYDWKVCVGCTGLVLGQPTIGPAHAAWTLEQRIDVRWRWSVAHPIFTVLTSRPRLRSCQPLQSHTLIFPHDFLSEVGFGDTHSTFFNPNMFTTSNFRGFPYRLNYPGDLIFSNRSHQPQRDFEYGVGGTGLGLSEIHASNSHSLQVPGGHLQGVDDIGPNVITLQDSS